MSKRSHQDDVDDLPPQSTGLESPTVSGHHGNPNGNAPGAGHLATLQAALGDRPAPRKRSNPGPRPDLATLLPTLPASPALPMGAAMGALGSPSIASPGLLSPSHPHQQQQHWGPVTANLVDSLTNSTANLSVRSRGSSMSNGAPPFLGHHVPSPADLSRALSQLPQYGQEQQQQQAQQPLQQPMPMPLQFQPVPPSHQQQQQQQQQLSPQPFDFVQQQFFGSGNSNNGNNNQQPLTIDTQAASQYVGPSSFTAPHLRGLSANSATSVPSPTPGTPESLTAAATPTSATTPTLPHLSAGETLPSGASSAGSNPGVSSSSTSVAVPKRRPRATPDQLKLLEETFLQTTSPNAQLRAELAHRLAMTERSVQIWFQNKRAKVKNAQRKSQQEIQETAARAQMAAAYGAAAAANAVMTPGGPMGWPTAANSGASPMGSPFIHAPGIASPAGDPAGSLSNGGSMAGPMDLLGSFLFSVDSLTVGTWRRAAQYSARSLFCAYALSHQLFTWTITDNNYTFKMEMPFQNVAQLVMQCVPPPPPPTPPSVPVSPTTEGMAAQVAAAAAAQTQPQAELVITLTQPPMFWMQVDTPTGKLWTQCNDFTENRQADTHLVHKLRGPPDALRAQVASLISSDAALRERTTVEDPNRPGTMYSGDQVLQVLPALMPQGIAPAAAGQQQQQIQQGQPGGPPAIAARPPGVGPHVQHPAVRTLVNRPRRSASAPMPPSFRSSPSAPSPLGGPALMPGLEQLTQQQQMQMQQQHQFQHQQQAGMLHQDQRTFTAPHLRNQSQPSHYMADPSVFQVPANAPPMPNAPLAMASPYNMMDLSQLAAGANAASSTSAPASQHEFTPPSSMGSSVSASASPMVATNRPGRSNSDPAHVNLTAANPPPPMPMPPSGGDLFSDVFGMQSAQDLVVGLSAPMDPSQLAMYSFGNAAAVEGCDPNGHSLVLPNTSGGQHQHAQPQLVMMPQQQHQQQPDHSSHQPGQTQQHQPQQQQQQQQQTTSASAEFDMLMSSLVNV